MRQAEFEQHVGQENICSNIAQALARAKSLHADLADKDSYLNAGMIHEAGPGPAAHI
jgi:hypothetical protein